MSGLLAAGSGCGLVLGAESWRRMSLSTDLRGVKVLMRGVLVSCTVHQDNSIEYETIALDQLKINAANNIM